MNAPRNPCPGGGRNAAEPGAVTGYNGEHVRCGHCHRRMKLDRDGKVPAHNLPEGVIAARRWLPGDSDA